MTLSKNAWINLVSLLVLAGCGLSALAVSTQPNQTAGITPGAVNSTATLEPAQVPSVTPQPAGPESTAPAHEPGGYENPEGYFSLKLPDGWQAAGPFEIQNDPARPYVMYILGAGNDLSLNSGPGLSKILLADASQWSIEQFIQDQCSTCPVNPSEAAVLGGLPAQRTQIGGGSVPLQITWHFVEIRGKLLGFAIHDPESLAPLEAVLQSIQFE